MKTSANPALGAAILLTVAASMAQEQMACGTTDDWFNTQLTKYIIPEYFPFDEAITNSLAPSMRMDALLAPTCRKYGTAKWAPGCIEHDRCMEARGLYGQSSVVCDNNLLSSWQLACDNVYGLTAWELEQMQKGWASMAHLEKLVDKARCQTTCNDMAKIAYNIMAAAASDFPAAEKILADVDGNGSNDAVIFQKDKMYVDRDMRKAAVQVSTPISVWAARFYKAGDFNGDGYDDLLMMVQGTDYAHPYWSNGDGSFAVGHFSPWRSYTIGAPEAYHVGDFNNDRIDDLIHFVPGTDYLHIWYGSRNGQFSVGYWKPWAGYTMGGHRMLVGDFDGDSFKDDFVDLVGTYAHLWRGDGSGTFSIGTWKPWEGYSLGTPAEYQVVDLDRNGTDDIVHRPHHWKWTSSWNFLAGGFTVAAMEWGDYFTQR